MVLFGTSMSMYNIPTYKDMLDLVQAKLAVVSVNNNLSTFKYHRRVMYDQLWDTSPFLMECRGITFDNQTGKLVLLPFRKSFNYTERGTWQDTALNTPVVACKKFNGFMGQVAGHENKLVFGTTGSTKSDFVKMFEEAYLDDKKRYEDAPQTDIITPEYSFLPMLQTEDLTNLYEIVLEKEDPHIVKEARQGCIPLAIRCNKTGELSPIAEFDQPYLLEDILELRKTDKGEGWMLYCNSEKEPVKIKTDYYVGKKKLMRMSKNNVIEMYKNLKNTVQSLPDYWKFAVKEIIFFHTLEVWVEATDQERRVFLEYIDKEKENEIYTR